MMNGKLFKKRGVVPVSLPQIRNNKKINEIKAPVLSLIANEESLINSPKDKNRFPKGSEDVIFRIMHQHKY